ncbi:TetR/AcrR family transcriptional regulator [Trujillonella endophytica]|uniref:TetR/AcrR family transcriptional regulator n=1 Tax=Trujillonella endophytica TaxID=673521 RepID=UPI00147AC472|nr:TetR family transcriptional regulator [Trujillella endophytica]
MTGPGLRERKKADTRAALARATLRLAREQGWAEVTVEQIAAAADVSSRTFFNHFSSKEEALLQPAGAEPGRFARQLAEQPAALPAREAARAVLRAGLAEIAADEDGGGWRVRMEVIGSDPALLARAVEVSTAGEREMAEALARRAGQDPDRDLEPVLLAAVLGAALRVTLVRWACAPGPVDLPALFDEAVELVATGLPGPAALS